MGEHGEEVRDRVLVHPQARRADQHELAEIARRQARHLGGDHAAHRVTDEVWLAEPQRVHQVPAVQGEVEHVLQQLLARRLAVARPLGREHGIPLRELVEERVVAEEAAGAVEKDDGRAAAALQRAATRALLGLDHLPLHRFHSAPGFSAPGRRSSGRMRSSIGCIHQRSSCFHSGQRSRKWGMTFSAKSFDE